MFLFGGKVEKIYFRSYLSHTISVLQKGHFLVSFGHALVTVF